MPANAKTTARKTKLKCNRCNATRFTKLASFEFVNGEEKEVDLEYQCFNGHVQHRAEMVEFDIPIPEDYALPA